jgi:excisionase family DNA binding protein
MTKPRATVPPASEPDMLDTREVAAYLRLKERRVYDLVRDGAIPHLRATGKLLFRRRDIDAWLSSKARGAPADATTPGPVPAARPPIIAGSHDPLLEWAARESGCGLAILACGSRDGVRRLAEGAAVAAAMHWRDPSTGEYNVPLVHEILPDADIVVLEWARRTQGMVLAPGNPRGLRTLRDLLRKGVRVMARQPGAGSHLLLRHLLADAGIADEAIAWVERPAHGETELAAAIRDGRADAGVAIEAAARELGLDFIPLTVERLDLACHRRDAFEPPLQTLLAFARTEAFAAHAGALGGYDVASLGRVVMNA